MGQTAVVPTQIVNVTGKRLLGNTGPTVAACEQIVVTDFMLGMLDDADAATARTTLGVGAGTGDALVANSLDQFADVTQTAGKTLAITDNTTLNGGTHSGTNTGDQDLSAFAEPSNSNVGSYHLLQAALNPSRWQHFAWLPQVSTTINYWGGGNNPTITGTLSHVAAATTNYRTSRNHALVTGGAGGGSFAQIIENNPICYLGDAAGRGGFYLVSIFAIQSAVTASIGLWGLAAAQPAAATTEASAHVSFVGMACDSTDTNMQIMHNDASGAATKVDLGASFPARTANTVYRLFLFCANDAANVVKYQVDRLDSAASASGSISTNLPTNTTFLKRILRESNNATPSEIRLNMYSSHLWVKY